MGVWQLRDFGFRVGGSGDKKRRSLGFGLRDLLAVLGFGASISVRVPSFYEASGGCPNPQPLEL